MFRVFNMGIGMLAVVSKEKVGQFRASISETTYILGELAPGSKKVLLK
jgi:phosphoribosylaminoimidazole (AIR) synthetase